MHLLTVVVGLVASKQKRRAKSKLTYRRTMEKHHGKQKRRAECDPRGVVIRKDYGWIDNR
jgi:hypothetical protein